MDDYIHNDNNNDDDVSLPSSRLPTVAGDKRSRSIPIVTITTGHQRTIKCIPPIQINWSSSPSAAEVLNNLVSDMDCMSPESGLHPNTQSASLPLEAHTPTPTPTSNANTDNKNLSASYSLSNSQMSNDCCFIPEDVDLLDGVNIDEVLESLRADPLDLTKSFSSPRNVDPSACRQGSMMWLEEDIMAVGILA